MSTFCGNCGKSISRWDRECPHCGAYNYTAKEMESLGIWKNNSLKAKYGYAPSVEKVTQWGFGGMLVSITAMMLINFVSPIFVLLLVIGGIITTFAGVGHVISSDGSPVTAQGYSRSFSVMGLSILLNFGIGVAPYFTPEEMSSWLYASLIIAVLMLIALFVFVLSCAGDAPVFVDEETRRQQMQEKNREEVFQKAKILTQILQTLESKYMPRQDKSAFDQLAKDIRSGNINEDNLKALGMYINKYGNK